MTKDIDVLYFYEYAARELDVAFAVKHIAEQHYGLAIHIEQHPYGELLSDLTRFRPRVVTLPQLGSSNVPFVLEWPKATYLNLMWEQLLYKGNIKAKMPRGEFALQHVIHQAWSNYSAKLLQDLGVPDNHILMNGNPAYVLYDEPYRRFYERRTALAQQYRLDPAKPWIFFPENYNWAFYVDAQLQSFIEGGQTAEEVFDMRVFCLQSFTEVMKWCQAVAQQGIIELIIRPRPATALNEFITAVCRVVAQIPEGMHIIKDESIREWIIASDIVVSSYSTSLIEAAVAGKPTYILEPYPIPDPIRMDWQALMPHLKTQAEFDELCRDPEMTVGNPRLNDWARNTMLPNGDAIWGLADFLARLCRGEVDRPRPPRREGLTLSPEFNLPPWLLYEYHKAYRWYQRFSRKIKPYKAQPSFTHEREIVNQAEIARRVNCWKGILADYRTDVTRREQSS